LYNTIIIVHSMFVVYLNFPLFCNKISISFVVLTIIIKVNI